MSKLIHYSGPAGSYLLPSGYTRLAWIESDGTAAIDTGMTFSATTIRQFEVMWISNPTSSWMYGANSNDAREVLLGSTKDYLGGAYTDNPTWQQNVKYNISISTITGNMYCRVNQKTPQRTSTSSANNKKEYLFGLINTAGNTNVDSYRKWRLYNYKIWNSGVLVRDYVPVQKADGTIGVLNLVDNSFSTCAGLIAGPECPQGFPTSEYCQVEWLEGIGTESYIDTGIKGNLNTDATLIYQQLTSSDNKTICLFGDVTTSNMAISMNLAETSGKYNRFGDKVFSSSNVAIGQITTYTINKTNVTINGSVHGTFNTTTAFTTTANLTIGKTNGMSSSYINGRSRLYRCTINEATTVKQDWIPCYRRSDMCPGMYDIVGRQFKANAGTGSFLLGPSITFGWGEVINNVYWSGSSELPSTYQHLEYIESTGTQWINTGYVYNSTNNSYKVKSKFQLTRTIGSYPAIYGAYSAESANTFRLIRGGNDSSWLFNSNDKAGGGSVRLNCNSIFDLFEVEQNRNSVYLHDITTNTRSTLAMTHLAGTNTNNKTFVLFAQDTVQNCISATRLYYFKLFDQGTLVRDMVPCKRKSDNVLGMYDLIGNTFYTNNGTGVFTAGPETYPTLHAFPHNISTGDGRMGEKNGSFECNGSTSLITGDSPSESVRTVMFWMKPRSLNSSGQNCVMVDAKSRIGFGKLSSGAWLCSSQTPSAAFSANITAGNWYHVAIVNTGSSNTAEGRKLYVNGVECTQVSQSSNWSTPGDRLDIGKRSTTSDGFNGWIQDFKMFDAALSQAQIQQEM